jgi:hypothetical protein
LLDGFSFEVYTAKAIENRRIIAALLRVMQELAKEV